MEFSRVSAERKPSPIRVLMEILRANPAMMSLGGGMPEPSTFPLESISVTLKDGTTLSTGGKDLEKYLQYSPTNGMNSLLAYLKEFQAFFHGEPFDHEVMVGTGSQDLLTRTFEVFLDESSTVLVQEPCYPGVLAHLRPLGCKMIPIPSNLSELPELVRTHSISVMYINPTLANPSSETLQNRKEFYDLACRDCGLIVLEDDPYYFLEPERPPSLLSFDTLGKVVRFDSLSKVLAPGLRIGWMTGHKDIVNRVMLHSSATIVHTSGISQLIALQLLQNYFPSKDHPEAFEEHLKSLQHLYVTRVQTFVDELERLLGPRLIIEKPKAGMFIWFRIRGIPDSKAFVETNLREANVVLLPGCYFMLEAEDKVVSPYMRAAISLLTPEQLIEAAHRIASAVPEEE